MPETVIEVENISKQYRLGLTGTGTLSHDLKRWWYGIRGKEDPYLKIGETNDRSRKGESDYVWSLKEISFDVKQGEVLGIIGRNGAGKSTLLKILSKVTTPTEGEVRVKGRIASLLEVGTGFHPDLTGRENVFMNGAILGMTKREIKRKFDEIVNFSGVERYIDTPVKRYSSGMYVRLAFAVAAHLEPEILIVDEVLAVGDAEFQEKCLGKMKNVAGHGRTVLFVSHNMNAVKQLCTRSICLENGRLTKAGRTDEVVSYYFGSAVGDQSHAGFRVLPENGNEPFQIRKVALVNSGGAVTSEFSVSEDIYIELDLSVKEEMRGLYGYLTVTKIDGTLMIEMDNTELGKNVLSNLQPGEYKLRICLSSHVFSSGQYSFYLNFTSKIMGNSRNWKIDFGTLVFQLRDDVSPRGKNRRSLLSMLPGWEVVPVKRND